MNTSRIPISKKIVMINSISSFLSLIINVSILVWLQQYLLKNISAEEYALMPVVMSIMGFVPLISIILTSGLGRYITVAYSKGDDEEVKRIVSTMFPILCSTGIFLFIVGCILSWNIDSVLTIPTDRLFDARLMLGMLMFVAAAQLPASAFESGFAVTQRLVMRDLLSLGCQLLNNILLFILLFGVSTRVLWVVTALAISQIIYLIATIPISIRLFPAQQMRLKYIHWPLATEISTFGGWNFVSRIAYIVRDSLDPLILAKFALAVDVAAFNVGGMPYRQVIRLVTPLLSPIMPILGALEATNQVSRIRSISYRYSRYCLWLSLLVSVPTMVFSKEIIQLYIGNKYADASLIIILLLSSMILQLLTILCPAVAIARGMVKGLALREMIFMVLNIILTVVFVVFLKLGAIGSAFATFLSTFITYSFLIVPFSLRIIEGNSIEFARKVLFPGLFPSCVFAIILLGIKHFTILNTWPLLIFWSGLGASIYCLVLYSLCLNTQDHADLKSLIANLKKKIAFNNV